MPRAGKRKEASPPLHSIREKLQEVSMDRLIKAGPNGKFQQIVRPGQMRFLDFARLRLGRGEHHSGTTGAREYVLDVFSGEASMSVETAGGKKEIFQRTGGRADVFSGPPVMVYLPPQSQYVVAAASLLDRGIFLAPSKAAARPKLFAEPDPVP